MTISFIFQQLGIALVLGLLVGLQRESVASRIAGLRTFPLVTVFGLITALLAQTWGGWMIVAGLVSLAVLIFSGKMAESDEGKPDPGLTTEVALLLMYGVGAYLMIGYREIAIAMGGGIAVLLHFKGQLHNVVMRLSDADLKAIMQFALISLVILPILPNKFYGPNGYDVFNPRNTWLMVVLIVGINLSGYIIYKFFGEKVGLLLAGLLGGLISSTATTVSYARRTAQAAEASVPAAIVILIASCVVFVRLLLEIATVSPVFLPAAFGPLLTMMIVLALVTLVLWLFKHDEIDDMPDPENPSELKSALLFGLFYSVILFAVAFAREKFGSSGLYFVAAISGLTDVDAITLSTSQLVNLNRITPDRGWRLITVATISNLLFKALTIAVLGHRRLLLKTGIGFVAVILSGVAILLFWPSS